MAIREHLAVNVKCNLEIAIAQLAVAERTLLLDIQQRDLIRAKIIAAINEARGTLSVYRLAKELNVNYGNLTRVLANNEWNENLISQCVIALGVSELTTPETPS
jgi:hypothetical protein